MNMNTNKINLKFIQLKTFTEQDALDYCLLNDINPDNITELDLSWNKPGDISGIKLFKNLKELWLDNNKLTDISFLKDLTELKILNISYNQITDISVLKNLNNLEVLYLNNNEIKDISVIQYLNSLEILDIAYLELESDQIKYINSLKNLEELWCDYGFKDMDITDKLNKNIEIRLEDLDIKINQ